MSLSALKHSLGHCFQLNLKNYNPFKMASFLQSGASPDFISTVVAAEKQSDQWASGLSIELEPNSYTVWGYLTQVIKQIEKAASDHGFTSQRHRETMMNLSRASITALEWLYNKTDRRPHKKYRWTSEIDDACTRLSWAAHNYSTFISCFTMWHKNRMAVEVISKEFLRFWNAADQMQYRVRAYQQGVRRPGWPHTIDQPVDSALVTDASIHERLTNLLNNSRPVGMLGFHYAEDSHLLQSLFDHYLPKLELTFRRPMSFDLGGYTIGDLKVFFAALMSICTVHEHLCFRWQQAGNGTPFDSLLMVFERETWVARIAKLSSLPKDCVAVILADMTYGRIRPLELYVHPFCPEPMATRLFLVPHFVLNSRVEENALRVCSYAHPTLFGEISNAKEDEMRQRIVQNFPEGYTAKSKVFLEKSLPDIDLLVEDSEGASLLICELKWARKTIRAIEQIERDSELTKGFKQLRQIRTFLQANPSNLRSRGFVKQDVSEYKSVTYLLIVRDHMVWIPPENDLFLVEFDALIVGLQKHKGVESCLKYLKSYEWLPIRGEDFFSRFEKLVSNGVVIETEIFHRTLPA